MILNTIYIHDGEVLLAGIAILIDPFDVIAAFAILLKEHVRHTADKACGIAGSIFVIGIGQIFYFILYTGVVSKEILFWDAEGRILRADTKGH